MIAWTSRGHILTRDQLHGMEETNEKYRRDALNAGSQSTQTLDSPRQWAGLCFSTNSSAAFNMARRVSPVDNQ
jgi:hypothetical protein